MKITKRQLTRIIREEKRRMRECGEMDMAVAPEPAVLAVADSAPEAILESTDPMGDMLVEMEVASRALETVVESVQNAAQLCPDCGAGVAEQTPIVEAMAAQAEALQEMVDAQTAVIQENADVTSSSEAPVLDAILDVVN